MTRAYAEIQRLLDVMHAACEAEHAARTPTTRNAARAAQAELTAARTAARTAIRDSFASQYGWQHTAKGFSLHELRNGHHVSRWTDDLWPRGWLDDPIDHAEYYRFSWIPYFPASIISHEYGSFESSVAYAKANGLIATLLPASWYAPESAIAIAYTGPLVPFP